jgi:hypothetical protein
MNVHQRIVSEDEVEKALAFLRDSARDIGAAKARVVKAGHYIRHVEALEYKASTASSIEGRKNDARTAQAYLDAINEDAEAAGAYEVLKALREAAALKIEAWRSEQANYRAMKI